MTTTFVIGIDPGPVTGIVAFQCRHGESDIIRPMILETHADSVAIFLGHILAGTADDRVQRLIAIERFVVGSRAARSATAAAGQMTRTAIGEMLDVARGLPCVLRSAAEVKPWATDARLKRAALFDVTSRMTHARDAARHALFAAVRDCGLIDPLITVRSIH
jgi:hypothetical protein